MAAPCDSQIKQTFVARGRELGVLRAAWESVRAGSGRVVAIEGEPGVGKDRACRGLPGRDSRACHPGPRDRRRSACSLGVLAEIFGQLPSVSATDRAMALNPQALPTAVRETLAGYLRFGDRLVIFLDDAQWADEQSLAVLMDAGRRLRSEPVLLVVAYQAHERSPFPASAGSGLARAWRTIPCRGVGHANR